MKEVQQRNVLRWKSVKPSIHAAAAQAQVHHYCSAQALLLAVQAPAAQALPVAALAVAAAALLVAAAAQQLHQVQAPPAASAVHHLPQLLHQHPAVLLKFALLKKSALNWALLLPLLQQQGEVSPWMLEVQQPTEVQQLPKVQQQTVLRWKSARQSILAAAAPPLHLQVLQQPK